MSSAATPGTPSKTKWIKRNLASTWQVNPPKTIKLSLITSSIRRAIQMMWTCYRGRRSVEIQSCIPDSFHRTCPRISSRRWMNRILRIKQGITQANSNHRIKQQFRKKTRKRSKTIISFWLRREQGCSPSRRSRTGRRSSQSSGKGRRRIWTRTWMSRLRRKRWVRNPVMYWVAGQSWKRTKLTQVESKLEDFHRKINSPQLNQTRSWS